MTPREQQIALYRLGFDPGRIDGVLGPKSAAALKAMLVAFGFNPANVPDDVAREILSSHMLALPLFIAAKNFTPEHRTMIDRIVIHTAEAPEIHKEALNVAGWFQQQPNDGAIVNGVKFGGTSAHYVIDDVEIVQCVLECDRAWHVGVGNENTIGIEHAGYASQTPEQWDDEYSKAVLARSAELVARLCLRFSIPMQKLSPAELVAGKRGIAGHIDFSDAYAAGKGHKDPGPAYPWTAYIGAVHAAASSLTSRQCSSAAELANAAAERLRGEG